MIALVRHGLVVVTLSSVAVAGAGAQPLVRREFRELHMGMAVRVVLYAPDERAARDAARAAFDRIAALEDIMSDYRPSSEVRRLTTTPPGTRARLSEHLCAVLAVALDIAKASDGAFDPTVGPLVDVWRRVRERKRLPEPVALEAARRRVGWQKVHLDRSACTALLETGDMRLDLGGVAKGYILERARDVLRQRGITRTLLEAGGDIVVGDPPPDADGWHIGVTTTDLLLVARTKALSNAALSTSGDTEQFSEIAGVRYSHIVDPRTGLGVTSRAMAWVIADDAALADALATTFTIVSDSARARLLMQFPSVLTAVRRR
jgi:FAD:protein FMN transferase